MAETLLIHHPCFLDHVTAPGHPERVDRLHAVHQVLADPAFDGLRREEAPLGELEAARQVHTNEHVDHIEATSPTSDLVYLDADTAMSPGSLKAARHALGGALHAVDRVLAGDVQNAFCAMRPPGHHAESQKAMGFCLFNAIAAAARHAQKTHGVERVVIFDFDVHHGNGTQEIFWDDASVTYISTHQMPLYPGTGAPNERGEHGNIVNARLEPGSGSNTFQEAVETSVLPAMEAAKPDLILLSAGFDAHSRDPLAQLELTETDFAWVTREVMALADRVCEGRIVSVLEGGYDLQGLSQSVAAHVTELMTA